MLKIFYFSEGLPDSERSELINANSEEEAWGLLKSKLQLNTLDYWFQKELTQAESQDKLNFISIDWQAKNIIARRYNARDPLQNCGGGGNYVAEQQIVSNTSLTDADFVNDDADW